ncbi:MAG TPA: ATP-binding protein [Bacteroidota bacterium]|nr:ATP-binding protein [Bacteroidota bacterium]
MTGTITPDGLPAGSGKGRGASIREYEHSIESLRRHADKTDIDQHPVNDIPDALAAMHQLSEVVSSASDPERIVSMLMDLTDQIVPVLDSNFFVLGPMAKQLIPFRALKSHALEKEARDLLGNGIIDWVIAERMSVVLPDPETISPSGSNRNFVIIPLYIRNEARGVYLVYTEKPRLEFRERDIRLLTVLARQAAAGIDRWHDDILPAMGEEAQVQTLTGMIRGARLAMLEELATAVNRDLAEPLDAIDRKLTSARNGQVSGKTAWSITREVGRLRDVSEHLAKVAADVHASPLLASIPINRAIETLVHAVHQEFSEAGIEIETACAAEPPVVTGHEHHLQHLLLSLLASARDAMPKGGKVTIATEPGKTSVQVSFSAAGAEMKGNLGIREFRPFQTSGRQEADLGLLHARRFFSLLGGTINIEREKGHTTTMTINLPKARTA